jgi:hypothetical protein
LIECVDRKFVVDVVVSERSLLSNQFKQRSHNCWLNLLLIALFVNPTVAS